jgi:uncharacterized protein
MTAGMTFALGEPVRLEMEKWGDRPHWQFDAIWLGSDEYGDWIGIRPGTAMSRPGLELVSQNHQVGLLPRADLPEDDRWWVATFHDEPHPRVLVYVDIASPPRWEGHVARTVDLDLDVIRLVDGEVYVDDEDEFAEHQVEFGYPPEVIETAQRTADVLRDAITRRLPPYDGSHERWLSTLRGLTAGS